MKEARLINRFFEKKNSHLGKWAILGLKTVHPHNSGSAGRIFLKFCTMKGANRQMRLILIIFEKKKLFGVNGPFWTQKWHIVIILDPLQDFFKILHSEKGQQVDESNDNGFYQQKIVQDKWAILDPKMAHPHNSGSARKNYLKL